jgi:potassium/hydrogen antiporter
VPGEIGHEFIGYQLADDSPVLNKALKKIRLPGKSQLLCLLRNGQSQILQESEKFQVNDHVFFLSNPEEMESLEKLLVGVNETERLSAREFFGDFVIRSHAKLSSLSELYQFTVPQEMQNWSIARYILSKYRQPVIGDRVSLGHVDFVVLSIKNDRLEKIGLKIHQE